LSELKELARSTMMKFPFSSKNYAAVFRDITGDSSTDSKI
jgi:hypothetical protein